VSVLRSIRVTEIQRRILQIHYGAPSRTISARQIARALGYKHYSVANSQYGRLGRSVRESLGKTGDSIDQRLGMFVTFEKRNDEWHWLMRPEVAEALERLGWVEAAAPLLPEEVPPTAARLVEGAVSRVLVNAYERNPEARRRCIEAHGTRCCICGFSFGAVYGEVAEGYIHVHHLRPLSEIDGEYAVDPIADLRPICPNCHAVLRRRIPAFGIEEVRALLQSQSPAEQQHPADGAARRRGC
jgi:5-methylcytosine-specific restriction protein A